MKQVQIVTPKFAEFSKNWRITAVSESGKVVGHVFAYLIGNAVHHSAEKYYLLVDDLRVEDQAQGQGIGRKLMVALIVLAKEQHCYKIVANSHKKRVPARALYESLGFRIYADEFRLDVNA
jgi:GNAT superfamily N-acetyltransferase